MNKIRKILQSALSILMAFVLVFAVGCSSGSGDGGYVITPAPEAPAPTFELSLSQIDCIVGDTDQLSPKSLPNIGDATLTWRSEDSKIVAVDNNGKFEALSEGTTKIIATYGPATATCTIKVSWDSEVPQIVSPANDDEGAASWQARKAQCFLFCCCPAEVVHHHKRWGRAGGRAGSSVARAAWSGVSYP